MPRVWDPHGDNKEVMLCMSAPEALPMTMSPLVRPELVPFLAKYGSSPADLPSSPHSAQEVADKWVQRFEVALLSGEPDAVLALLVPDTPIWRDLLVLSWAFRTLVGPDAVRGFLAEFLVSGSFLSVTSGSIAASVQKLSDSIGWVNAFAVVETPERHGTAVLRLIPTRAGPGADIEWKAHGILMDLDGLRGHPSLVGPHRRQEPVLGGWEEALAEEGRFADRDPTVIIIGGSQCGLATAAQLKVQGVPTLVLERTARLGDMWRNRYDALTLHDPVHYTPMPLLPYPPTFPVYIPAKKLASFLEDYASILELHVWLSATVTKVHRQNDNGAWNVDVNVAGEKKTVRARHVIFAMGYGSSVPSIPTYPGLSKFMGEAHHSSTHKTAKDHIGKKVVVVGAANSGLDVCADFAAHGIDVTLVQRSPTFVTSSKSLRSLISLHCEGGPPTDVADRLSAAYSLPLILTFQAGAVPMTKAADKELLDGLERRGFRLTDGPEGTGTVGLASTRGGGFHVDTGACARIIDGTVKVKSDAPLIRFDERRLVFDDGSVLPADVVIWATGFADARAGIRALLSQTDAAALRPVQQMDAEGESGAQWQDSGIAGLYVGYGGLSIARYWSKHLALRIKAIEIGILEK